MQAAVKRYHRPDGLSARLVFLIVLEAGKASIKVPKGLVSCEVSILGLQMADLLMCPHMVERDKTWSLFLFL